MKKIIFMIALMMIVLGGSAWGADVGVTLNGAEVVMDASSGTPYLDPAGRVMVPLRAVLEKAGAHVEYDTINRLATVTTVDTEVIVPIGQSFVVVNHVNKPNDAPAKIVKDRTYLPIRIVMESLGYKVSWDSVASKVIIVKPGVPVTPVTPTTPVTPATTPSATVSAPQSPAFNTVGNTSINLYNGGMIARENQWLYFVNFNDNERIWRVDVNTGIANVVSGRKARSINVVKDWVYYCQETIYNTWEIHKTKGDGTADQVVLIANVSWLKVENETLYYYQTDPVGLYQRGLEDTSSKKILDLTMIGISLEDGYLTFAEMDSDDPNVPGEILRYRLSDLTKTTLLTERSGDAAPLAAVVGSKLLYCRYNEAQRLYSKDLNTGELTKLSNQMVFNVSGGNSVYYTLYPDALNGLYKIPADGNGTEKMSSEWKAGIYYDPHIHVSGDYLYYMNKNGTYSYEWVRVNLKTNASKTISKPADLIEK